MSFLHLHLLLNHVPVIGMIFVVILTGIAFWRRHSDFGKLALVATVALALVAGIVFLTGEPAEERVEHLAGIAESAIHAHEEIAEAALVASIVGGVLALLALAITWRRQLPRWILGTFFGFAVGISVLMGITAYMGGQIRHTELVSGSGGAVTESDDGAP